MAVAAIVLLTVIVLSAGREGRPARVLAGGQGQQNIGFRSISRPDLGYAVDIPVRWLPAADNSATTTSYADNDTAIGSLRVTVGVDPASLSRHVNSLVQALDAQDGTAFATRPGRISGLPAIELDYRFPVTQGGPAISNHTSFLVKRGTTVFSFHLATTDPAGERPTFAQIEKSIHLQSP